MAVVAKIAVDPGWGPVTLRPGSLVAAEPSDVAEFGTLGTFDSIGSSLGCRSRKLVVRRCCACSLCAFLGSTYYKTPYYTEYNWKMIKKNMRHVKKPSNFLLESLPSAIYIINSLD